MTVQLTAITGAASANGVPLAKVMPPWISLLERLTVPSIQGLTDHMDYLIQITFNL